MSEKPADEASHPKFGNVSQHRLRQIVRAKKEELNMMKKDVSKKMNPQNPPQSIRNLELAKPNNPDKILPSEKSSVKKNPEGLPRIKIHSQPNERPNDRIVELLAKMKEEERRRYDYNRPSWWG